MTVTVRTLETPEPASVVGWSDKPVLVDVEHRDGQTFTVQDGLLYVWGKQTGDTVAVYSPGNWIFAKVNAEMNAPVTA